MRSTECSLLKPHCLRSHPKAPAAPDGAAAMLQRAHQNTLENLPSFLTLLLLNGLAAPVATAAAGMAWNLARVAYVQGYRHGALFPSVV
jgi:uncharacterized MAPEG superfamily protein